MASKDNITPQSHHKAENKLRLNKKHSHINTHALTTVDLQNIASLTPRVVAQKKKIPALALASCSELIICCRPPHGWTGTQTKQPRGLGRQQKEDGVKSQGIYFSQAPQKKKKDFLSCKNHSMHHLATDAQCVMINEAGGRIKKHIFTYFFLCLCH